MGLRWIFWDDDDLARFITRTVLHSQNTFDKIVVEIEQRIPNANTQDDISGLVEPMVNEYLKRILGEIGKDIENKLRQDIYEEISRSQVIFENKWNNRLNTIENNLKNHNTQAQPDVPNIDLSPLNNINQIQKDIEQVKKDIGQLGSEQQKFASRLWNVEFRGNTPPVPTILHTDDNRALTDKIEKQNLEIENLKKELTIKSQKITAINAKLNFLLQRITKLENPNRDTAPKLTVLQQNSANLPEKVTPSSGTSEAVKSEPVQKPTAPSIGTPSEEKKPTTSQIGTPSKEKDNIPPPSKSQTYWIQSFSLPKISTPVAYFHGDGKSAKENLAQSIQNMDSLITYLSQSKIEEPARTSFMKNLKSCMDDLEKLYGKFNFDGCDADELSEEITNEFFKILSNNLMDNVLIAIYRGGKSAVGYNDFLQKINDYLSQHGIYTQEIVPGIKIKREIFPNIEHPIAKRTDVAADDGKIDEVELLPYFMYYENDDGNPETIRKRGRIVYLKYGE
ncbi:MAG: hypothetical protein K6G55_04595 [Selenomonadaceae bacterium]|nr:hypothetical protein [Selenomonadaceae bacterium]